MPREVVIEVIVYLPYLSLSPTRAGFREKGMEGRIFSHVVLHMQLVDSLDSLGERVGSISAYLQKSFFGHMGWTRSCNPSHNVPT